MKKLNRWEQRLNQAWERVSRGKKLAVNLTLCALIGVLIWIRLGCPLPTAEMEFRRLERTNLMPPSEIVFSSPRSGGTFTAKDGTQLHLYDGWFIGVRGDRAVSAQLQKTRQYSTIVSFPLEDGPTLVPFARWYPFALYDAGYWVEEASQGTQAVLHSCAVFLLLNPPEGLDRAEFSAETEQGMLLGGGWLLEDGSWLLYLEGEHLAAQVPQHYTLRLYRADGSLLMEKNGTLEMK